MKFDNDIARLRGIANYLAIHAAYFNTLPNADSDHIKWAYEEGETKWDYLNTLTGKPATYVSFYVTAHGVQLTVHGPGAKLCMTEIRRHLGGKWEKEGWGETFSLDQEHPEGFLVSIEGPREQVCTPRRTGTRTVKKRDPEALKSVPMVEVEEPVIEWDCDPILTGE